MPVRNFAPVEVHSQTVQERLTALQGKQHAIDQVFGFLRQRGLLVGAQDMVDKAAQGRGRARRAP